MRPNGCVEIWKERYIAAILEIDREKVLLRVCAAKMAICDRIEELSGGGSASERAALNQAMKALTELQSIYEGESQTEPRCRITISRRNDKNN